MPLVYSMGNSTTLKDRATVEKGFILETQASSLFFGDYCVLLNSKTGARLIRKEQFVDSTNNIEQISKSIGNTTKSHLNVIFPHEGAKGKQLEAMCRGIRVTLYYTWLGTTLKGEIQNKRSRKQYFSENEAWFILNELSRALQQLAEKAIAHWDIRSQNIFKNHNENYYIYDPTYLRGGPEFLLRKTQTGHYCNLSRQAIESIIYTGGIDFQMGLANDIFAAGLTIMEVLTLKDPNCYYRVNTLNEALVQDDLQQLDKRYSRGLLRIVSSMVTKQKKRVRIEQLRKILRPKEFEIVRQSNFYQDEMSAGSQFSGSEVGWVPEGRRHQLQIQRIISPGKDSKISLAQYNRNTLVSPRRRDSEFTSNSTVPVNNSHRVTQTQNTPKVAFNNSVMAYQTALCRWDRHNRKE